MKRIYSIFTCLILIFAFAENSYAQTAISPQNRVAIDRSTIDYSNTIRLGEPAEKSLVNGPRANTSFEMDYDITSANDAAFIWWMNQNYTANGNLNYAIVAYDSLITQDSISYDYNAHTVLVDSVSVLLSHRNSSGQNDSLIVSLVDLNANGFPTNSTFWADTIVTNQSLTPSRFQTVRLIAYPNIAICSGRFGLRVDFIGPTSDTLGVVAGFRETLCALDSCGADGFSAVPFSSNYQFQLGDNNPVTVPTETVVYYDCNGNGTNDIDSCENFVIQDFWFSAGVTISDIAPSVVIDTLPDFGTGTGEAWIEVSNLPGSYEVQWNNGATSDTITGLSFGPLSAIVTYGHNCTPIPANNIIRNATNIEDELRAGITQLETFPNPTSDQIALRIELDQIDDVQIRLFDLNGKVVFTDQQNKVNRYSRSVSLADFGAGVYLLEVETTKGRATKRVVVL